MAVIKRYKCQQCGYEADVYTGKGFMQQHILTMTCTSCHRLTPLVVGGIIADVAPSFSSEAGRICLYCGSSDMVRWDGRTCPRCGGSMEATGKENFWV